ncbi:MAG: V-type ATP synthase subunit E family protein [Bacteroidia bacterium]|nr:V-type ATP synthase subunit E family protein [Bacteroidia bacterium]
MDKLQELTDKLYNEGLAKGKEEGAKVLEEAKKQAEKIIAEAKEKADALMAKAQKEADDYNQKVCSDLKMAAAQSFQATKKDIENMIITKISGAEIKNALSSAELIKGIIRTVAEKFSTEESQDLSLVLPASLQDELEPFVKNELSKLLEKGVDASFSKKTAGGFSIGPKDGGYFISLTDETFNDLISEYLRPVTKKILFG